MLQYYLKTLYSDMFQIATNNTIKLIRTAKDIGISFSKKQTSEFMSSIVESAFVEAGKNHNINVIAPKVDHEPDLYVDSLPMELKTKHKVSGEWRGGAFSKRSCEYLFISYNIIDNYLTSGVEWFAIQKYVDEGDWKGGNVGNYYATRLGLTDIIQGTLVIGDVHFKRKKYHSIHQFIPKKD